MRAAAGERLARLELAQLIYKVAVTGDRQAAAEQIAAAQGQTAAQVLASPYFLIGSVDEIAEVLLARRERHGISYLSVFPADIAAFAPVVARLAGK